MPAPATSHVPYTDFYNRAPFAGSPVHNFDNTGVRSVSPGSSVERDMIVSPSSAQRRIAHMLKKPTLAEPEAIDIKPYSGHQAPAIIYSGMSSPASTHRSWIREPRKISLDQFQSVADMYRTQRTMQKSMYLPVECSDRKYKDETRLMIDRLKNPLTPPFNPDLAGVGNSSPVRRYYTTNNMYSQLF